MRIIDTFLFSEPYEKEILLVKFNLGGEYIHEWVLIENSYTHQGEYKGLFANEVLKSDERFKPFMDRIKIISGDLKFTRIADYDDKASDKIGVSQEYQQRDLVKNYLLETYSDEDYFLISDTDECLDLTSRAANIELLYEKIRQNSSGAIKIPRKRYWYDFDNVWDESRSVPCIKIEYLRRNRGKSLGTIRFEYFGKCKPWKHAILFEYSYCLKKEYLFRKYQTFCHVGIYLDDIELGLKCNQIPVIKADRSKISLDKKFWLRKIQLNEINSPRYVRENFENLCTGIVDKDFETNRKIIYAHLFSNPGRLKWKFTQLRFFVNRLKNKFSTIIKLNNI